MTDHLRIFISSPGDVDEERRRAAIVIGRIHREFARFFDVSPILWEYDPMLSSGTFQDVIEKPSNTDIVVLILWSRLGTPLPAERYRGIDGRTPVTGTEWEFEDALAGKRVRGTPDLLVYRKLSPPQASFADPAELQRAQQQWDALQEFWLRHFVEKDGTFKAAFNHFSALDEFESQLERHLRILLHERVSRRLQAEGARPISWHSGSPFRGLSVFGPEHAAIFFGREKAEQELVEILARRAAARRAFVAVLGSSGSGKSSLLRAGVLPTIETPGVVSGVMRWRSMVFTPSELGADPFVGFAERLLSSNVLPEAVASGSATDWATDILVDPDRAASAIDGALVSAARSAGFVGGDRPLRLFLLVDQLEEIFTSANFDSVVRENFSALLGALSSGGSVWIAASMRADFFPKLLDVEALAALTAGDGSYALASPRAPQIERMIKQPAEAGGFTFEIDPVSGIGLDAEILDAAVQSPEALPLLEFTLDELYRRDIEEHGSDFLTFATYRSLGGLEGAIAAQAEATVAALPDEIAAALPIAIRSLVQIGDDDTVGARSAPIAELSVTPSLAALTDALVSSRLAAVSNSHGQTTVRVAHEALLRAWPRAASLISADRDMLRTRARAEHAMLHWRSEGEQDDLLLPRGRSLAEAVELLDARRNELNGELIRFVEKSAAADEGRRQRELAAERARAEAEAATERERTQRALEQVEAARRLTRRTRIATVVLGAMLVIAVATGIYATFQRAQAELQRNEALESQSHFLADAASAAFESGDARLARLLALAALPTNLSDPDRPYVPAAEAALAQAWGEDRLIAILPAAPSKPTATANPTAKHGRYFERSQLLLAVVRHLDKLSFAFSGRGDLMVVAGQGRARIYDLQNAVLLDTSHTADKGAVALDYSGTQLAQGEGADVRLWNVKAKTSRLLQGTGTADDKVLKVTFSPNGRWLVAAGAKGVVSIWSLPEGRPFKAVHGVIGPVYDIRISSNSSRAVVVGADGQGALYNLSAGSFVALLGEPTQQLGDVNARTLRQGVGLLAKFSDDGAQLATLSSATRVRIWDAVTGNAIGDALTQDGPIQSLTFEDRGTRLAVRLLDGRTYLWLCQPPGEARLLWAHADAAAPLPHDEILITDKSGLHIVDQTGRMTGTLLTVPGLAHGFASPDGRWTVATVAGASVALVPVAGGPSRTVYRAPAGQKVALADFTPNGRRILVFVEGGPSALIDASSGHVIGMIGDGEQTIAFIRHSDRVGAFWKGGRTLIYREDGQPLNVATPPGFSIIGLTGDENVGLLATVGIGSATVFWSLQTGQPVGKIDDGESLAATRAAFRVGREGWIARADINQSLLIWPWPKTGPPAIAGPPAKRLMGHSGQVIRLRVTPEGRLLSESLDNTAILWDPRSGRMLARYQDIGTTSLSDDGRRLIILGTDGAVRVASMPPSGQYLLNEMRSHAGSLTEAERDRYFLIASHKEYDSAVRLIH